MARSSFRSFRAPDELVVEARVAPNDIDQLVLSAPVLVLIMAGNQRTMPDVSGVLTRISADVTRERETGQSYYLVRATLPDDEIRRLGDLKVVPGMPAEAFIRTDDRTPLQYLLKPLQEQIARTFRER